MDLEMKILDWLDEKFPRGIAGWGPWYALTHPWVIVKDWGRQIKWAHQRVFRGWDDRAVWGIDDYLAKLIPQLVRKLAKNNIGYPCILMSDEDYLSELNDQELSDKHNEQWLTILNEIAIGFEEYVDAENECRVVKDSTKFDKSFELLHKYFSNLWD